MPGRPRPEFVFTKQQRSGESRHPGIQSPTRGGVRKGYAAHIWKSELALVRDNSERDVLSSVFSPVRSKIDF